MRDVAPERHLVTQWVPQRSTWTFALCPQPDGSTRFISRNRLPATGPLFWLAMIAVMEPGSLVMERKMLLGVKERAERLHSAGRSAEREVRRVLRIGLQAHVDQGFDAAGAEVREQDVDRR